MESLSFAWGFGCMLGVYVAAVLVVVILTLLLRFQWQFFENSPGKGARILLLRLSVHILEELWLMVTLELYHRI
ncbi:BAH_G0016120.mRNA.1.CDS.1 [Saccharomyces cerevisiae]|nr:BAH_G0016120.mRNA.1.CDS.1 [Saccharomyces cerevisiae]CAI7110900.1 BAH_G0016120.mRNA.1.CDS.1 [Saccharomyces cerevisiae]